MTTKIEDLAAVSGAAVNHTRSCSRSTGPRVGRGPLMRDSASPTAGELLLSAPRRHGPRR